MDLEQIESLIEIIKEARVTELSVKRDGSSVLVRQSLRNGAREAARKSASAKPRGSGKSLPEPVAEPEIPAGPVISAPMVGIFHLIDGIAMPGATVKKGQAVGVIESMKLMNEVVAQEDGQIAEVYVEDGMPVEYGQTLFRLEQA